MNINRSQVFEIIMWALIIGAAAMLLINLSNSFIEEESHENNSRRNTANVGPTESK
jgi:hypothetical protein